MRRTLELTTRVGCQNKCSYCPQDTFIQAYRSRGGDLIMKYRTFTKCLDKTPDDLGVDFSAFAEPWLNPDCTKMIEYAHQQKREVSVFTTGVGMTIIDIDTLEKIPFRCFIVHLPDDRKQTKIKVSAEYIDLIAHLQNSNIKNLSFLCHRHQDGSEGLHPALQDLGRWSRVKLRRWPLASWSGHLGKSGRAKKVPQAKSLKKCDRLNRNILLPNGDVLLCCMDWAMEHPLGNLLSDDYQDLFKSKYYHQAVQSFKANGGNSLCRRCQAAIDLKQGEY